MRWMWHHHSKCRIWAGTRQMCAHHTVLDGLNGADFYFVHGYAARPKIKPRLSRNDYDGRIVASLARDNMIGTQFHPESQAAGLRLIENFVNWKP